MTSEVTSLEHKLGNNAVKSRSSVTETVLARAELTEVLCSQWDDVVEELERDTSSRAVINGDVKLTRRCFSKLRR